MEEEEKMTTSLLIPVIHKVVVVEVGRQIRHEKIRHRLIKEIRADVGLVLKQEMRKVKNIGMDKIAQKGMIGKIMA